jgi:hypothetical protein
MLQRAREVIANPDDWHLDGSLIWVHHVSGANVTDQLVSAVREGRFSA